MSKESSVPRAAGERKALPIFSGVLLYFPDALLAVADVSKKGNDQHNPGEPLHWAKEKSADEADALLRHLIDAGKVDVDGVRHSAKVAWRALALLQREIDAERGVAVAPDPNWKPPPKSIGLLADQTVNEKINDLLRRAHLEDTRLRKELGLPAPEILS